MSSESTYGRERHRKIEAAGGAYAETWLQRRGDKVELLTSYKTASSGGGGGGGGGGYRRCSQHGCLGEALQVGGDCFAHATPEIRTQVLAQAPGSSSALCLRGTSISQALWDQIAKSPVFEGGVLRAAIMLAGAEINASIRLEGVRFARYMDLSSAAVFQHIELRNCVFDVPLSARYAFFSGAALNCTGSTFHDSLDLSFSVVERTTFGFSNCKFERGISMDGFSGAIDLQQSSVRGNVTGKNSTATLLMNGCELHAGFDFSDSALSGLHGERLIVHSPLQLGPCAIQGLLLQRSVFLSRVYLDVVATTIDLTGATMREGGMLLVEKATMRLDQMSLDKTLRVSGKVQSGEASPQILGLMNSDAGHMSLSRVDLARCSFLGAHGLGNLDVDSTVVFARTGWLGGNRRFIADEFAWRCTTHRLHRVGWELDGVCVGHDLPQPKRGVPQPLLLKPLVPAQVETLYRELRRGLESKSDMHGAADFYYGEMEMRRWGRSRGVVEMVLVWCYWALSGYGLRPLRALISWAVLVGTATAALVINAIPPEGDAVSQVLPLSQALLISIRASIPGFSLTPSLGPAGQWIETIVRVLGTVCIALFVIATRSRLMRKPSE